MGHYLSDFETDDEYYKRVVLYPMLETLRIYDREVDRGIMHTDQWNEKMTEYRGTLQKNGYNV